jgi:hypothetical protein
MNHPPCGAKEIIMATLKRSPLAAIRAFCVECQGGSFQGVAECADRLCPFMRTGAASPWKPGGIARLRSARHIAIVTATLAGMLTKY